ncbi:1,4-dihydroxy-2-naphthoate octaprenyltransferase [bacterium]|nr:1,4-dihydroxy-2-naphthoate octaprenyltransferase [bacterium]
MSQWKAWILAARPKTLPAAIVPVWSGSLLAYEQTGSFHLSLALLTVFGAISIQVATNFFNDVIDSQKGADTRERVGPQRVTVSGLLAPQAVYFGAFLMLILASFCGWFLFQSRGWPILLIGIPSLYLSFGYTGGPFPLAYRGMGELFVILFFGLVAVGGTVFVQTGLWTSESLILGVQIGLLSAVLIAVNNYRDVSEDAPAGKLTLAVRFGRPLVRYLIVGMTLVPAMLILCHSEYSMAWFLPALGAAVIFVILELKFLSPDGVPSSLLGLSALHLILFVSLQNFAMSLT